MIRPMTQKNFMRVRRVGSEGLGKVQDHLSSQFTVRWSDTNKLEFLFYKDKGVTWRMI